MTLTELADVVRWLPAGCALWRSTGGPLAWSEQVHMLVAVEFRLHWLQWVQTKDGSEKRNHPKPMAHPPYSYETKGAAEKADARVDAWQRRQSQRSDSSAS